MENMTRDEFDQIVSHTIRIELTDGSVLHFEVSPEAKKACRAYLLNDSFSFHSENFVWFYIPEDRLVFIKERDIIRLTFCFDTPSLGEATYCDNYNVLEKYAPETETEEAQNGTDEPGEELDLPQLIIKHAREKEDSKILQGNPIKTEGFYGNVSCYFDMNEEEFSGLSISYLEEGEEWVLQISKYIRFWDADGEENFMLLDNLSVIEIERSFIMTDEHLSSYLGKT